MSPPPKSFLIQTLQHIPFFSLHNLPPLLLPKFLEFIPQPNPSFQKLPIPIHLTPKQLFKSLLKQIHIIKTPNHLILHLIFFQPKTQKIISPYKQSTTPHPLNQQPQTSLIHPINQQPQHLSQIPTIPNYLIHTTKLKPKQLNQPISNFYLHQNFQT
ncbi:RNase adapter RapZ, partial [Staphylococcus epidermidis]|uniref:RNase adapter RapZ n=1 Tax=Staphylococcus epidermidis TaxID=1282 RepID=UPI0037D9A48A